MRVTYGHTYTPTLPRLLPLVVTVCVCTHTVASSCPGIQLTLPTQEQMEPGPGPCEQAPELEGPRPGQGDAPSTTKHHQRQRRLSRLTG